MYSYIMTFVQCGLESLDGGEVPVSRTEFDGLATVGSDLAS